MLDPALGRWFNIDPYSEIYEDISPYNYALNSPITVLDPDGRLVVYVNGFRPDAYRNYLKVSSIIPVGLRGLIRARPPWEHKQRFFDKVRDGDVYDYWGRFNINFAPNEKRLFVDGMFTPLSSGDIRFGRGVKEGKILAKKIKSGEITLKDGETIKLIGHSHGGAHAMGMAQGLLSSGISADLINVFLFAPHQPNQIKGVDVTVYQFSREGDLISSKGVKAALLGSFFDRVLGAIFTQMPDGNDDGRGNHGIETYTSEEFAEQNPRLYLWLVEQGIIKANTGELIDNE